MPFSEDSAVSPEYTVIGKGLDLVTDEMYLKILLLLVVERFCTKGVSKEHAFGYFAVGLGGIAILVLDISYRKIPRYYYLSRFLLNLCIDCSIRVFRSFY